MAAIEAVIFDYGGVLSTTPFAGIAEFERQMGYPEKSLAQLLFGKGASPQGPTEAIPDHDWHLLETGRLTLDEFHERLASRSAAALGKPLDLGVYAQFLRDLGVGVHWMVVHRVRELRAEGYRTAILTNNIKEWGRYWKESIPLDLFDVVVDSCDVGLRKPDPAIFRLTCERLGVAPEAAVLVDLPNSRKSSLFNALTGANAVVAPHPFSTTETTVGIAQVPDDRLWKLAEMSESRKVVPAGVEFVDIAALAKGASTGEGLGNKFLGSLREVDALVYVLRAFDDPAVATATGGDPDPAEDLATLEFELVLAHLAAVQGRLHRQGKAARGD